MHDLTSVSELAFKNKSVIFFYTTMTAVTPEPMIYVGFEQTAYTFSESELEASNEVCVVVSEASPGVSAVVEVTLRQDTALGMLILLISDYLKHTW